MRSLVSACFRRPLLRLSSSSLKPTVASSSRRSSLLPLPLSRGMATTPSTPPPTSPAITTDGAPTLHQALPPEAGDTSAAVTRKFTHRTVSEPSIKTGGDYTLPHPIWNKDYLEHVEVTHRKPQNTVDKIALYTIRAMRFNFDWMSGFMFGRRTEAIWLNRIVFLETVAGVPGSIGATVRHLASLRRMRRDHGWIHTLLEEAENERMHLLTAIQLRQPGKFFRLCIFLTQGVFFNFYWIAYLLNARFCHRLVAYLEEEAVKTYTQLLKEIDAGKVFRNVPAPDVARSYWHLGENANMREVIANIRADESHHRDVNHEFASLPTDKPNPFGPGH